MSYLNTKQALITHLLNNLPTGMTSNDIAFENRKFNPANKDLWAAVYLIPSTSESMGKTDGSANEDRGVFQVSVFVPLNGDDFDNKQLTAIDEFNSAFKYNSQLPFLGQVVQTLESTVNSATESGAWLQRDLSISYLTFSDR